MDRVLRKGVSGLAASWLSSGSTVDHPGHVRLKETLSSADGYNARVAGRQALAALSETDNLAKQVLDTEKELRDGCVEEPPIIVCPSVFKELCSALARAT